VCPSCGSCTQAASGQLSFVWGLVACWQSQSLRITPPQALCHSATNSHSDKQTVGPFCSGPFPLLLSHSSITLTHRCCRMKNSLFHIWVFLTTVYITCWTAFMTLTSIKQNSLLLKECISTGVKSRPIYLCWILRSFKILTSHKIPSLPTIKSWFIGILWCTTIWQSL